MKRFYGNRNLVSVKQKIHFIAIGGAVMHNLAIALHQNGHDVSGSDDVIYGKSLEKLRQHGLLPTEMGWHTHRITEDLDLIILGMHAKKDNPELQKALDLGIQIESFPSYIAKACTSKRQIVVSGSHGKTTTTSMIMHILQCHHLDFDYLVGAQLDGFDLMVKLSDAPIIVIEGDEYFASAIDMQPKFYHYNPDVLIVTGIAWDHANVFPTEEDYTQVFSSLINRNKESTIFYDVTEPKLMDIIVDQEIIKAVGYHTLSGEGNHVTYNNQEFSLNIFGEHNRKNMHAALLACNECGIKPEDSLRYLESFSGAAMRQQVVRDESPRVYRDFGHAPSKVRATIKAIREMHPKAQIGVLVELHTYSSMRKEFLPYYAGVFNEIDLSAVAYDPHAFEIKNMEILDASEVANAFGGCKIVNSKKAMQDQLKAWKNMDVVLLLSSGNLFGVDALDVYSS